MLSGLSMKFINLAELKQISEGFNEFDVNAAAAIAAKDAAEADAIQTAEDRVQTGEDVVATGLLKDETTIQTSLATEQAVLTAADRVQTGLDVIATGEDRVQTGLDVMTLT